MATITSGELIGHLGRGLTPRQLQCVMDVAQGFTNKEIARRLNIAEGTVEKRLAYACDKLGTKGRTRTALAIEAMKRQIISSTSFALAALIAMHTVMGDGDPMRRERRMGDRRVSHLRVERKADAFECHA